MITCRLHWRDGENWSQQAEGLRPGTHDLTRAGATVPVQERLTVRLVSFPLQCLCFLNGPRWANTETRATGAKHISGDVRSQQEKTKKKATTFSEILTSWKLIFKNPLFLIIVNTIRKATVNCYLLRHLYEG